MASPGFGLSGDSMGGLLTLLGGLAGFFPKTGSSSTSSSGTSDTSSSNNLQSLLNTLSTLTGSSSSTGTTTGTTTGGFASTGATNLSDQLARQYAQLANKPTDLSGYEAQQIQNINQNTGQQNQAQQEALAARGLATSPVSAAIAAKGEAGRVGQITGLQQQLPLLQQQLQLQNMGAANSFLANAPRTSTQTGSTTGGTQTTQTGSTNQFGQTNQQGNSNTNVNQNSNTKTSGGGGAGGLFGGLGGVLASLFG